MCQSGVNGQAPQPLPNTASSWERPSLAGSLCQFEGCCAFKAHLPRQAPSWQGSAGQYRAAAVLKHGLLFSQRAAGTNLRQRRLLSTLTVWQSNTFTYRGCQVSPKNRKIEHRTQVWERTPKHLIHPLQENFKIPWKPGEDHKRKINLTSLLQTINLYISKYNPQHSQQTKVINYLTCHLHNILSST